MSDNVTPIRPGPDDVLTSADVVVLNRSLQREPTPSTQDLRDAVEEIDRMAQTGFGQVAAIAHLARKALQASTKDAPVCPKTLIDAFTAIAFLAEDTGDGISIEAEAVGCNHGKSENDPPSP